MGTTITTGFNNTYPDGPPGSPTEPEKSDIRNLGVLIQTEVDLNKAIADNAVAIANAGTLGLGVVQASVTALGGRVTTAESDINAVEVSVAAAMAAALAGVKPRTGSVRLLGTVDTPTTTGMEAGDIFDSVALVAGDRIAKCYNGATGHSSNGIWIVQASGAAVRATDFDSDADIRYGWFTVEQGSSAGQTWGVKNTAAITVNTTAIVIERVEAASGVEGDVNTLEANDVLQNQQLGIATKMSTKLVGMQTGTPANGTASSDAVYVFSDMAGADGHITAFSAYCEGAGTIQIRIYGKTAVTAVPSAESGVSSLVWLRTYTLTAGGAGVGTWNLATFAAMGYPKGLPIAKNERIGLYGGLLLSYLPSTDADSGGMHPISGAQVPLSTALLGTGIFNVQMQARCTISYAGERIDQSPPWMVRPGYEMVLDTAWSHMIEYGQSNSAGAETTAISTTPSVRSYTFNVGPKMTKPGITGASGVLADDLAVKLMAEDSGIPETTSGVAYGETSGYGFMSEFTRRARRSSNMVPVWLCSSAGHSGYALAGGNSPRSGIDKTQPNSVWYPNLVYHVEAGKREATQLGLSYQAAFVGFDGLETDTLQSAPYALVLSALRSLTNNFRVDAMEVAGQERRPIWLATTPIYGAATSTGAIMALMDFCEERKDMHFIMPGYRLQGASAFHYFNLSQHLKGAYRARAAHQYVSGRIPDRCWWRTIRYTGTAVIAVLSHPGSAITFNTAIPAQMGVGVTTDYGIKIVDGTGTLTLSSIAIGATTYNPVTQLYDTDITMNVHRAFGANPTFRYALDYQGSAHGFSAGADGNIYDNTADTVLIGATTYTMAHGAPPVERAMVLASV